MLSKPRYPGSCRLEIVDPGGSWRVALRDEAPLELSRSHQGSLPSSDRAGSRCPGTPSCGVALLRQFVEDRLVLVHLMAFFRKTRAPGARDEFAPVLEST